MNDFEAKTNRLEDVEREVREIIKRSPIDFDLRHAELVLSWVLRLKPDADEALQIAALSHDMERGVTGITEKDLADYSKIDEFKKEHAMRSAQFICDILQQYQYPQAVVDKVRTLVENHEVGGDAESDILRDADSIAYFEYNIPGYLKRYGEERTKQKIMFMYKRMSPSAQQAIASIEYNDEAVKNIMASVVS